MVIWQCQLDLHLPIPLVPINTKVDEIDCHLVPYLIQPLCDKVNEGFTEGHCFLCLLHFYPSRVSE